MVDTVHDFSSQLGSPLSRIPPSTKSASLATTCGVVAGSTIRRYVRTPKLVLVTIIQAALFLAIFRYVLGGAIGSGRLGVIGSGDVPYVDFLVPGYVMGGVLFSGAATAAGVAEDVEQGLSDRLRSLPVSRVGLLAGRAVADTALATCGAAIAVALGFIVGFRIHGDVASALLAFALCVGFSFSFTWIFLSIGLLGGSAQVAQGLSMLVFPLTTVSSALVPVETMPGWLQAAANNQPITAMTNAVRSLVLGGPAPAGLDHGTTHWVLLSLAWCLALVTVFAPLAVLRYRRS